jgi:hypothetical protein
MKLSRVLKIMLSLSLLAGCASKESKLFFCDAERKADVSAFVNFEQQSIVFGDVFFKGRFGCEKKGHICFNSEGYGFDFNVNGASRYEVSYNKMPWGADYWVFDRKEKDLYYISKKNIAKKSTYVLCSFEDFEKKYEQSTTR